MSGTAKFSRYLPDYSKQKRFRSLQAMRFFAAAAVACAHAVDALHYVHLTTSLDGAVFENLGAIGVDIFFVISGFIISITAMKAKATGEFLLHRFVRVVPIYWLASIPMALWVIRKSGFSFFQLLTTATLWPVWGQFMTPFLDIGWTLSFEILFYICIGVIISRAKWQAVLAIYATLFVVQTVVYSPILHFLGNPIILEFLFGVLIARVIPQGYGWSALAIGLLWLGATLMYGYGSIDDAGGVITAKSSLKRVMYWGVPSAMIIYGVVNLESFFKGRLSEFLAALGDSSYSLYLTHLYSVIVLSHFAKHFPTTLDATLVDVVGAVIFGWVFYRFVERPLQFHLKKRLFESNATGQVLIAR